LPHLRSAGDSEEQALQLLDQRHRSRSSRRGVNCRRAY
jgi:hypothetical protein